MDGQTATLVDDPKARLTETPPYPPFCGPPEVNGLDWLYDRPNAFQTDDLPLGTMGFVRLGGLDPSPFTIPRSRPRRRFAQSPDDDGPPPAHAKSSLERQEFAVNDGVEDRPVVGPQVPTAVTASIEARATTRAPSDAPAASSEADRKAASDAIEGYPAPKPNGAADAEHNATSDSCRKQFQQLQDLSKRVAYGDEAAITEIQRILDSNGELWHQLGDVEKITETTLLELLAGSPAVKESVRRSVTELKQSLLGVNPTPLERMAVGRVVACWLFAHFIDRWCGWAIKPSGRASDLAKLLEASEKRYGTALKSLKLVQETKSSAKRRSGQSAAGSSAGAERQTAAASTVDKSAISGSAEVAQHEHIAA